MDGFVWLHNPETGGHFHCPPDAVEAWTDRGWELAEQPPPEPDKTRDEPMLAALAAQLAPAQSVEDPASADGSASTEDPKPTKTSRRTAAATDEKE